MTNLISGKEALIAIANGEEVEYLYGENNWLSVIEMQVLITAFTGSKFKFRLKPRTITLTLEIPAPFEPKEGEKAYRLAPAIPCGYTEFYFGEDENEWQFGAWRTEDEVKQVVAALRQVFGRSDDDVNAVRGGK